ncbi:class I SAM-dependent methyltransferase [Candidatus Acetothermia bacterium]|nr:class I SAM-dependent methyltransferase [Candidatus Acetothermia bacterium]
MSKLSDPTYLLSEQYKNAANLNARFKLHERFSINKYGWHKWVFDQFKLAPESRILELGCGPGYLWKENLDRIPKGWEITLSDFSPGMLDEAKQNLSSNQRAFGFQVIDAQSIPFDDGSFDALIANHMLYHVPDRAKAFSEIHRVLKLGRCFYAVTNGQAHLRELDELVEKFVPGARDLQPESFYLENGLDELKKWLSRVSIKRYEDALVITEAEPLVAYVISGRAKSFLIGDKLAEFIKFVEQEIATHGAIRITKDSGLFEAIKD